MHGGSMTGHDTRSHEVPERDVKYVATRFQVSERTVERWMAQGLIGYLRVGGRLVRFTDADIEDFIRRCHVKATVS